MTKKGAAVLVGGFFAAFVLAALLAAQVRVSQTGTSVLLNGQQAVTGTASALPNNVVLTVCVEALIANPLNVYVGGTSSVTTSGSTGGFELSPGKAVCPDVNNPDLIYVVASGTGSSVAWYATATQ